MTEPIVIEAFPPFESDPGALGLVYPARPDQAESIHQLIDQASRTTTVLPRSLESVRLQIADFLVALDDHERVVACGSLHRMGENLAEIRSLVVDESVRGCGLGSRIVRGLIILARRREHPRVFTLTDSIGFFQKLGFAVCQKETLPHKVWNDCLFCPKYHNCGETALDMVLAPPSEAQDFSGNLPWSPSKS